MLFLHAKSKISVYHRSCKDGWTELNWPFLQCFSNFILQVNGGEKRPASDMGKKPKTPKKKKKKDPNEPQKPVSAYALFFRDTQAAIKGQNPNATFGEVSKIVASMWDGLGEEQKQVQNVLQLRGFVSGKCYQGHLSTEGSFFCLLDET